MRTIAVTLMLCLPVAAFAQDAADNGHLLVRAAEAGQLDEVRRLMQAGTEVDAVDGAGVTGLMQAAAQDRVAVVQELLKHRPNLDLTEPNRGQTALHIAIARRRGAVVPLLLAAGAHVTATDRSGRTPLELALDTRSFRAARLLIRAGADPATKLHDGQPAICRAVAGRSADLLRLMLDRGVSANLNCPDARDGTLLLSAVSVEHDNEELLTILLAHGARIDEQGGRDGLSPLLLAAGQYKLHLVRYLIEHGADPNTTAWDGRTLLDMPEDFARAAPVRDYVLERWGDRLPAPVRNAHELLRAVRRGDPAELKRRLDDPAVKLQDPAGRRQYPVGSVAMQEAARLLAAAVERRPATVRFLLEHGARLSGEGHLVAAVGGGKRSDDMVATARLLIEAGASLEETDPYGQTPLHKAVTYGNEPWPAMLELLRRAGADRCHRNLMGQDVTAAAGANHPELLYWIEQPGWTCKTLAESLQIRPQRGLSPERLRALNAVALPRPQPALIVMEQTALRADPTPAARQTGTLTVGTRGAIVARMTTATEQGGGTGHWLRWDDGGRTGWVFSPSVAFIDHADAALLTGRLGADEQVTFELSLAGGTSRCALRVGTRRFAPDQQFGRWEKEEAPVATLLLLAGLSGATSRDPVCVSSISGTVQFCPLLSTPGAPPSFTPAPCVTMDTPPPSEPVTPFAAAYRQRVR